VACGESKALVLSVGDSVAVAVADIEPGPVDALGEARGECAQALERIPAGHKIALRDIKSGDTVLKYGSPIGVATCDIEAGTWVHEHNLRSALDASTEYAPPRMAYAWAERERAEKLLRRVPRFFRGYRRIGGLVGTRNELWVVPTVGCVNGSARMIASLAREEFGLEAQALEHPFGCSQLGGDLDGTRRILARLAVHPNAGATIVVSLGCENNRLREFEALLRQFGGDPRSLAFLPLQEVGDETTEARIILGSLAGLIASRRREEIPLSELSVGLKCGGSDGFSGITANPLIGKVCDMIVAAGGRAIMTEVPEMFGAEERLILRSASPEVYSSFASMVGWFKNYYARHGQAVYENPSPGNKEGGITTLEEKSLGCIRKAGTAPISGIVAYGGTTLASGLSLVSGPGNDLISTTALAAAGANAILFSTGRGTPFGGVVPTIKLSSNSGLIDRKPSWIDFDCGRVLSGSSFDDLAVDLMRRLLAVAGGEETKAESGGHSGIAIFRDGVTL